MTAPRETRFDVASTELLHQLVERPLPLRLGAPRAEHAFLRDVYLDTPDGRLRQYGITCRYRVRGDDRRRLTLLQPATDASGAKGRQRHEADLPRSTRSAPPRARVLRRACCGRSSIPPPW